MATENVKKVCAHCGSDQVKCDAWATWDSDTQVWVLDWTDETNAHCEDCDGDTTLEDERL